MNYRKIYSSLIERAKQRRRTLKFAEWHHIKPKCLGGSNLDSNLVRLKYAEHYVAHQLLVKIYPNNVKLLNAAVAMTGSRKGNKLYAWLKTRLIKELSTPENKKLRSEKLKTAWQDPTIRNRWLVGFRTKAAKRNRSNARKRYFSNPDNLATHRQTMRSPELLERHHRIMKERYKNPIELEKMRKAVKAAKASPKARKAISDAARKWQQDPIAKERHRAAVVAAWALRKQEKMNASSKQS